MSSNVSLGQRGEALAKDYLRDLGYRIVKQNYRSSLGEIDLIAVDKGTVCFIEVKTRQSHASGSGLEAVSKTKQKKLIKLALGYLQVHQLEDKAARFDVVAVQFTENQNNIQLIQNAFDLTDSFYS